MMTTPQTGLVKSKQTSSHTTFLKRHYIFNSVEADFENYALLVRYDVAEAALDEYGEALETETKRKQKRIRLKGFGSQSNVAMLAQDIVDRCEFIGESQAADVIEVLYQLQAEGGPSVGRESESSSAGSEAFADSNSAKVIEQADARDSKYGTPRLDDVDTLLESLYDENMQTKVQGTGKLMQLSKQAGHLDDIITNEALMGALSRMLKDDFMKSADLSVNIMTIFHHLSAFSCYHEKLMAYRIGDMTMKLLNMEIQRFQARTIEWKRLEELAQAQKVGDAAAEKRIRAEANAARGEGTTGKPPKHSKGSKKARTKALPTGKVNLENERRLAEAQTRQQDRLLFAVVGLLLNLATEASSVARKIIKRGVVALAVPLLERKAPQILLLGAQFLLLLSSFRETLPAMAAAGVVGKLAKLVPVSFMPLQVIVLDLLYNLAHDSSQQGAMVASGLVPKLVRLITLPALESKVLPVLSRVSKHPTSLKAFEQTNAMALALNLLTRTEKKRPHLAKLVTNLARSGSNVQLILKGGAVPQLLQLALAREDSQLLMTIRRVAEYTYDVQRRPRKASPVKRSAGSPREVLVTDGGLVDADEPGQQGPSYAKLWGPLVQTLVNTARDTSAPALLAELLQTLANLTEPDISAGLEEESDSDSDSDSSSDGGSFKGWASLAVHHGLVEFISALLAPGFAEPPVVLGAVMLAGSVAENETMAPILAASPVISALESHLKAAMRKGPAQLVLQACYTFLVLLRHQDSADCALYGTELVSMAVKLCSHSSPQVAALAEEILDEALAFDSEVMGDITTTIQEHRFKVYNAAWMAAVQAEGGAQLGQQRQSPRLGPGAGAGMRMSASRGVSTRHSRSRPRAPSEPEPRGSNGESSDDGYSDDGFEDDM